MINPALHKRTVPLDRERHRLLKLNSTEMDWSIAVDLNALFVMGVEFGDVSREYPILFVPAVSDDKGPAQVAPVAVFGLKQGENLFLEGTRWRGFYIPAMLVEKALLRDMRFDADLPDGQKLQVEGFFTVDEQKFAALGDAEVLALHKSGALALLHAHQISMGNMRKLVQWRLARDAQLA